MADTAQAEVEAPPMLVAEGATFGFELRKPRSLLSAADVRAASSFSIRARSVLTEASAGAAGVSKVSLGR